MSEAFFTVLRRYLDSDEWLAEPFTRGQAWVDLVGKANFKSGFIRVRGIRVEIPRGCNGFSQSKLATRWHWSRKKVANFLKELEMEQQIEQQKNNVTTLIKIVNYEKHQLSSTAEGTAKEPQRNRKGTATIIIEKNEKNEKNENNTLSGLSPDSESPPYKKIIECLNRHAGTKFRPTTSTTQKHIRARWKEGFRLIDFERVIQTKSAKWKSDPDMVDYLRPQTLFSTKFEAYLNESAPGHNMPDSELHTPTDEELFG